MRAGGEGEVVVPEQVRCRRGSGHRQGPPAPELQVEEATAPAIANLQVEQGAVRQATDEVEVTDQRQRRRRRRELATSTVLDGIKEDDKHADGR